MASYTKQRSLTCLPTTDRGKSDPTLTASSMVFFHWATGNISILESSSYDIFFALSASPCPPGPVRYTVYSSTVIASNMITVNVAINGMPWHIGWPMRSSDPWLVENTQKNRVVRHSRSIHIRCLCCASWVVAWNNITPNQCSLSRPNLGGSFSFLSSPQSGALSAIYEKL